MTNGPKENNPKKALVLKLGGSESLNRKGVDAKYIKYLFSVLAPTILNEFDMMVSIIGGGQPARDEQEKVESPEEKDEGGIKITQKHAKELIEVMLDLKLGPDFSINRKVPTSKKEAIDIFEKNKKFAMVLGGLEIGQSTDAVAATAAELFQEKGIEPWVVILSNVLYILAEDPRKNPNAARIKSASINQLIELGILSNKPSDFKSGMETPVDPVAMERFANLEPQPPIFFGHAKMLTSVENFMLGNPTFRGTIITPNQEQVEYYGQGSKSQHKASA